MRLEPVVICPDAHRPFHDKTAWRLFLKVARSFKPKHLVVIGDFADCFSVSSHSKDPRRAFRLLEEMADVNHGLDELDSLGAVNKVYISGNHEDRLQRYLQDKAPELFGVTDIPSLLHLPARGWAHVPYKRKTKIGKVRYTHDVGVAGRNAVFRALDTFQHSVVTGHTHRLQYIVEGNADGEYKLSAMFGWLGDADQVDYMHEFTVRKNWALAFGVGHLDPKTGVTYLTPVPIVVVRGTYSCVVNGRLFTERA